MIQIKKLFFYNAGHNGDIHYSRNFVKDIASKIISNENEYGFNASVKLLKDLKNITILSSPHYEIRDNELVYDEQSQTMYINTWIGSSNTKFIQNEIGCSLTANYEKFKQIYSILNLEYGPPDFYVPEIDWKVYDIDFVDNFLKINKFEKYVLISNGKVLSGQSKNINLNPIIELLADKHKNIAFIMTDSNSIIDRSNIFYTSNFINTTDGDLNEIAYLSTKCNLIVGRGSGPFCFCHNKTTLLNDKITLLALTNHRTDGLWALPEQLPPKQAKQLWSNEFDNDSIYSIIDKELN